MTRLHFTIPPVDAPTRSAPALPVNVHRAQDFAIVSRSVTGEDVSLAPGDYVAVVRFPNGREATQAFHLDAAGIAAIELDDVAGEIRAQVVADPVQGAEWTSLLPYDFIDFNPFTDDIDVFAQPQSRRFQVQTEVRAPSGDRWRYLAVAPEGLALKSAPRKTYLMAIPAPEEARVTITVNLDSSHRPRPSFVMPRVVATMLYRYMSEGAPEAAARLSGAPELCALDLVENKAADPISAALGMYLLLNTSRLEEIGERSEKLYRYNSRLADGAIIWAEHLARKGHHEEAAAVLVSLRDRGIPALTMGFRTAVSRVSTYIGSTLAKESLSEVGQVLQYWAGRTVPNSPTSVIELDASWSERVRRKLEARSS
jgi:hypothetical protein